MWYIFQWQRTSSISVRLGLKGSWVPKRSSLFQLWQGDICWWMVTCLCWPSHMLIGSTLNISTSAAADHLRLRTLCVAIWFKFLMDDWKVLDCCLEASVTGCSSDSLSKAVKKVVYCVILIWKMHHNRLLHISGIGHGTWQILSPLRRLYQKSVESKFLVSTEST